ncbi:MAG: hypothetical protein KAR08_00345 [Candidatus Heimdallarchaeota archaeon]|nr:hypothetical protein [Candidatus Heimdallarchaeota archaeon]
MISKKKGGIFVLIILLSLIFVTDHSIIIHSASSIGDFVDFDSFTWNVAYNNSFDPSTNKETTSQLILDRIVDEERIWYKYNDTLGDFVSDWMNPDLTVQNLPLGTTDTITNIPTLQEIIPNLCFMPIDWTENSLRFIDASYNLENDIFYIENVINSTITHNRLFRYGAAIRDVYIFEHVFVEDFIEDFTINHERMKGSSQAVYNAELGFLIDYQIRIQSLESSRNLNLSIELIDSSQSLGWSIHFKRFVGFMCTGFPYFSSWVVILSIIFTKVYKKRKKELEILEGHRAAFAEKMREKGLEEEDFYFINICPFCLEHLKKTKKKCPRCKGVR